MQTLREIIEEGIKHYRTETVTILNELPSTEDLPALRRAESRHHQSFGAMQGLKIALKKYDNQEG